jgi:O-antigen/teichoic acid export membrane protein
VTSGQVLARNTGLNLLGQAAPLLVAFFAVPVLARGLGTDRLGILTLAWTAIGYFSLFDLGLSRALTQAVSAALGGGRHEELPALSVTALGAMALLGALGGLMLAALTPVLVGRVLIIPPALHSEVVQSFFLLAMSLPFVLGTAGLRSLLEAHQDFGLAAALRIPYAVFNYIAPLTILPFSHSLVPVVAMLALGRVGLWLAHAIVCARRYPFLRRWVPVRKATVIPMLRQGGWMTVSNIVSPLMVSLDRFLVGALLSVAAVAYYAMPYDMLMKLLLIPAALLGVLFPAFAATFDSDRGATARLLERAIRFIILAMFPFALLLTTFAREGLAMWLGPDFARESHVVVQWLAAGVLINSIGQIPFAALQAIGRADLTAKLHAVELPLYTATILWLTRTLGLQGVAIAWTVRVTFDTAMLLWLSARKLPETRSAMRRPLALAALLLVALALATTIERPAMKLVFVAVVLVIFGVGGWLQVLRNDERTTIKQWLPRRFGKLGSESI